MLRRMSAEPATLADFGRDKFLDKELRPVCLKGVEDPLRTSLKASIVKLSRRRGVNVPLTQSQQLKCSELCWSRRLYNCLAYLPPEYGGM